MIVASTVCTVDIAHAWCCFPVQSVLWGMSTKCAKCHSSDRISGDTWCVGYSAWEAIGTELTSSWSGPAGLKTIGNNLVLGAARELRALRALGAGIGRAPSARSAESRGALESVKEEAGASRATPGLAAKSLAKPPKAGSGESEVYTYETETEEEEALQRSERAGGSKDKKDPAPLHRVKEEKRDEERKSRREEDHRGRSTEKKAREEKKSYGKKEDKKKNKRKSEDERSELKKQRKRRRQSVLGGSTRDSADWQRIPTQRFTNEFLRDCCKKDHPLRGGKKGRRDDRRTTG